MDDITSIYNDEKSISNDSSSSELKSDSSSISSDPPVESDIVNGNDIESIDHSPIQKIDGDIIDNIDNYPDDAVFQTKDVASFLGLSVQVVRNYAKTYENVLNITRKGTSEDSSYQRRVWTKKNINQLKSILELKRTNGWNDDKALNYLGEPSNALMRASISDEALEKLSNYLTAEISDKVSSVVMKNIQDQMKLIADNNAITTAASNEFIESSKAAIEAMDKKLDSILNKSNEAENQVLSLQDQLKAKNEEINTIKEESDKKIEEFQKSNTILLSQYALLSEKVAQLEAEKKEESNKKGFWFFRKK